MKLMPSSAGKSAIVQHLRHVHLGKLADKLDDAIEYDRLHEIARGGAPTDAEAVLLVEHCTDGAMRYEARRNAIVLCAARTLRIMLVANSVPRLAEATRISTFEIERFIDGGSMSVDKMNRLFDALGLSWRVDGDEIVSTAASLDAPNGGGVVNNCGNTSGQLRVAALARRAN